MSVFFGALVALILIRNRRVNIALLILLCLVNLAPAILPWTAAAGDA